MALRPSSPASATPDHAPQSANAETLNEAPNQRVQPDTPEKRWSALIAAGLIVISMFLPWWLTSYPIRNDADFFTGWQLLGIGLGFGDWPAQTGFSAFGRVLWGVIPTVVGLLLAVLLIVRATRPRALQSPTIAMWAVFTLLCQLWLVVLGWVRLDTTFGEFPTLWGMLPATMAAVYSAVTLLNWWRRGERGMYPTRKRRLGAPVEVDDDMDQLFASDDGDPREGEDADARDRSDGPSSSDDTDAGTGRSAGDARAPRSH